MGGKKKEASTNGNENPRLVKLNRGTEGVKYPVKRSRVLRRVKDELRIGANGK